MLVNVGILASGGLQAWRQSFLVQGLFLNAGGAILLALPDIPQLRRFSTPSKLRSAWQRLQQDGEVRRHHVGFDEIVDLIRERTSRISDPDHVKSVVTEHDPYGNSTVKADLVDGSDGPTHDELAEWNSLTLWVNDVRDQFRLYGVVVFFSGFVLQLLGIWAT